MLVAVLADIVDAPVASVDVIELVEEEWVADADVAGRGKADIEVEEKGEEDR